MTFREKLSEISRSLAFDLFIAEKCTAINSKMEEAARSGFTTFQIEIAQPLRGQIFSEATATNAYTIICNSEVTKTRCVLVTQRVVEYLKQLGFTEIRRTNNACDYWLNAVLKVDW